MAGSGRFQKRGDRAEDCRSDIPLNPIGVVDLPGTTPDEQGSIGPGQLAKVGNVVIEPARTQQEEFHVGDIKNRDG